MERFLGLFKVLNPAGVQPSLTDIPYLNHIFPNICHPEITIAAAKLSSYYL